MTFPTSSIGRPDDCRHLLVAALDYCRNGHTRLRALVKAVQAQEELETRLLSTSSNVTENLRLFATESDVFADRLARHWSSSTKGSAARGTFSPATSLSSLAATLSATSKAQRRRLDTLKGLQTILHGHIDSIDNTVSLITQVLRQRDALEAAAAGQSSSSSPAPLSAKFASHAAASPLLARKSDLSTSSGSTTSFATASMGDDAIASFARRFNSGTRLANVALARMEYEVGVVKALESVHKLLALELTSILSMVASHFVATTGCTSSALETLQGGDELLEVVKAAIAKAKAAENPSAWRAAVTQAVDHVTSVVPSPNAAGADLEVAIFRLAHIGLSDNSSGSSRGRAGFLYLKEKRRAGGSTWKRRWFTVGGGRLRWYGSFSDVGDPLGDLQLLFCTVRVPEGAGLGSATADDSKLLTFEIVSRNQVLQLQAQSRQVLSAWMDVLQQAILSELNEVKAGSTGYADDDDGDHTDREDDEESGDGMDEADLDPKVDPTSAWSLVRAYSMRNRECADCAALDPEWASVNLGITLCINCSGVHRSMGVTVSKVRSLTLDVWDPETLQLFHQLGNEAANSVWEAKIQAAHRMMPRSDTADDAAVFVQSVKMINDRTARADRDRYIRSKYMNRLFTVQPTGSKVGPRAANAALMQAVADDNIIGCVQAQVTGATLSPMALTVAANAGHLAAVEWLYLNGVSPSATPNVLLDAAIKGQSAEVVALLGRRNAPRPTDDVYQQVVKALGTESRVTYEIAMLLEPGEARTAALSALSVSQDSANSSGSSLAAPLSLSGSGRRLRSPRRNSMHTRTLSDGTGASPSKAGNPLQTVSSTSGGGTDSEVDESGSGSMALNSALSASARRRSGGSRASRKWAAARAPSVVPAPPTMKRGGPDTDMDSKVSGRAAAGSWVRMRKSDVPEEVSGRVMRHLSGYEHLNEVLPYDAVIRGEQNAFMSLRSKARGAGASDSARARVSTAGSVVAAFQSRRCLSCNGWLVAGLCRTAGCEDSTPALPKSTGASGVELESESDSDDDEHSSHLLQSRSSDSSGVSTTNSHASISTRRSARTSRTNSVEVRRTSSSGHASSRRQRK